MAANRNPELKGVPFALDLIAGAQDKQIMEIASAPLAMGRPLLAPPGASPELVATLRRSLSQTFADPAYLADCEKQSIACDTALSGEALADLLDKSYDAPDAARQRLVAIYDATGN